MTWPRCSVFDISSHRKAHKDEVRLMQTRADEKHTWLNYVWEVVDIGSYILFQFWFVSWRVRECQIHYTQKQASHFVFHFSFVPPVPLIFSLSLYFKTLKKLLHIMGGVVWCVTLQLPATVGICGFSQEGILWSGTPLPCATYRVFFFMKEKNKDEKSTRENLLCYVMSC